MLGGSWAVLNAPGCFLEAPGLVPGPGRVARTCEGPETRTPFLYRCCKSIDGKSAGPLVHQAVEDHAAFCGMVFLESGGLVACSPILFGGLWILYFIKRVSDQRASLLKTYSSVLSRLLLQ